MQSRLSAGVVAVLIALVIAGTQTATAGEPSRLGAFAARQGLCDQISYAMADGQIDRAERYAILLDAKDILKPDEYDSFKRTLNRISPPAPVVKRSPRMKKPQTVAKKDVPPAATPSLTSTIVAEVQFKAQSEPQAEAEEASWPDRVASANGAR